MQTNITITTAAEEFIEKTLAKNAGMGFRVSVKKTGCSGYSYVPAIIDKTNPNDTTFTTPSGIVIFIDTAWLDLLNDLHIDYVEEGKSGLKQKRLVFTNSKESGRCGCGESFHVE